MRVQRAADRIATLYICITTSDGRKSYCTPVSQSKVASSLNTQRSIADQYHKEGVHYLRFGADGGKQQFVLVGEDRCAGQAFREGVGLRDRERRAGDLAMIDFALRTQ
jgi:hypothetical protein